jgi:hypothetical protein
MKNYIRQILKIDEIINQFKLVESAISLQNQRITDLEARISDNTRALATLALVQANLIRAFSEIEERETKTKSVKVAARKPGTDFTN